MRKQPVSASIHASRAAPAATDAAAMRKAMYAGTYRYGIQSELSTAGCTDAKATTAAKQAAAPRSEPVQPYPTPATRAKNMAFSAYTASNWPFHADGTTCSHAQNRDSPAALTYRYAGPGW